MHTISPSTSSALPSTLYKSSIVARVLILTAYPPSFVSEYRKIKRPFPPPARVHPVAHPAPPEATSQPFSRPRGRLAGRQPLAARSARRTAGAGLQAQAAAQADWFKR